MKWHLLYYIFFLIPNAISIRFKLKSRSLNDDFTLSSISKWATNIPYSIPTINLCFGTPNNQCFDLAISLKGYTIIEKSFQDYTPILSKLFEPNNSTTFCDGRPKISQGFLLQRSPSHYVSGDEVNDVVAFPNNKPNEQLFKFVLLSPKCNNHPLNIEGFLSLRKYSYWAPGYITDSFLVYLKNTTQIDRMAFSIRYNSKGDGHISFGANENEGNYKTCSANSIERNPSIWSCQLDEFQIGDNRVTFHNHYIEFDSIRNHIIAPLSGGKIIFDYLIKLSNNKCKIETEKKHFILVCDENINFKQFPHLHLRMNEVEIILQWRHLFKYTTVKNNKRVCVLLLLVLNDKDRESFIWTLGIPGFLDNTFVFDKDNSTIGFYHSTDFRFAIIMMMMIITLVLLVGISLNLYSMKGQGIFNVI